MSREFTMSPKLLYVFCLIVLIDVAWCEEDHVFSNSWAVEVKGGSYIADQLAKKHGFINKGLVRKTSKVSCF